MRESSYVRSRRTTACGGTVFRHAEANGPGGTAQVVEHLGYPTRQCLERWLAVYPRYAGHMAKPIIPLETRTKAIEPVPDGMQQKRASERLGAGIGTVRNRVRAYREDGMAALRPENRDAG